VAPLTSGEAVVAVPMLEAARRAAALEAERHGGRVEVLALDDAREPELAAELVGRLAADARVIGVVGPKNSGSARAAIPVARRAGLPLLLPAATADDLCRLGDGWAFRLCATDQATAAAAVALCRRLGVARLAVVADATAYGIGLAESVRRAAAAAGIEVTAGLDGAGAVFHAMGEVEQAEAIQAVRGARFEGLLLGAEGGPGAALATLAGPAAEGAWQLYAGAPAAGTSTVYAAEAEDAGRLLVAAAAAAAGSGAPRPPSRHAVRAALASMRLDGASGPIAFTPTGERHHATVSLWRIHGGASVPAGGWGDWCGVEPCGPGDHSPEDS
jgi:ABC-type branched-subunit amino acid transport system substrate-binding protein